jgi:hypothetical protein
MAKIPKFKSLERAADFWDTHDFEDYREDTDLVSISVRIPRRKKTITVPLDLRVYRQIEALAAKRGVPVGKIVSVWLKEMAKAGLAEG